MKNFTNTAKGPRAILLDDTSYAFLQPNETKSIDPDRITKLPDGVVEADAVADESDANSDPADLEGKDLGALKRDELEAVAAGEGIDIEKIDGTGSDGNVLVDDIRKAIEAKREASQAG